MMNLKYLVFRNDDGRLKNSPANDFLTRGCGQWAGIPVKILNVDRKKISQKDRTLQSGRLTPFKDLSELPYDVTQGIVIGYTNLSHAETETNLLCKEKKKLILKFLPP
jgi:hypothetical protein